MYHVSTKFLGREKLFYPRKIDDSTYSTPCICVCPTIAQCILAMPTQKRYKNLYIYRTDDKGENKLTKQIYDYPLTKERRIYRRSRFILVAKLNKFAVDWITDIKFSISSLEDCYVNKQLRQQIRALGLLAIKEALSEFDRYCVDYYI